MVAVTLAASSAFASPSATSTTSSTVRPSPLTTTVRMATACHPPAPGAAAGLGQPAAHAMSHDGRPRRLGSMRNHDNRRRRPDAGRWGGGSPPSWRHAETRSGRSAATHRSSALAGHRGRAGPPLARCRLVGDGSNSSARRERDGWRGPAADGSAASAPLGMVSVNGAPGLMVRDADGVLSVISLPWTAAGSPPSTWSATRTSSRRAGTGLTGRARRSGGKIWTDTAGLARSAAGQVCSPARIG